MKTMQKDTGNINRYIKISTISLGTIILDQLSKYLIFNFAPTTLIIKKVTNTGAAFGLFQKKTLVLSIISLIAIGFIIYHARKIQKQYILSLSLILGGAIGNLLDRIFIGHVRDFISISIWPVFNLADTAITIGAAILIYKSIKEKKKI